MRSFPPFISGNKSIAAAIGFWLFFSLVLCFVQITQVPGYMHALSVNLLVGTLGFWVSIDIGRSSRERSRSESASREEAQSSCQVLKPALTSFVVLLTLIALSFVLALANGMRVGLCEVASSLSFYLFLPITSAFLVAAIGVLISLSTTRKTSAASSTILLLFISGFVTAWPIFNGPQAFAFNHFLGHVPGPIYDERFSINSTIVAWRALSVSWAALALSLGALLYSSKRLGLGWKPHFHRRIALIMLGLSGAAVVLLGIFATDLGFRQSNESIARALGGRIEADGLVIYYPNERDSDWVRRTLRDHQYQLQVLIDWLDLDLASLPTVHSYVFRSAAEKQRLTGAGRTSIAKPWLWSMYIHDRPYPHPILRHELAHALAADFGRFPFKVSARTPFSMNTGLIEGLAVAADWPADELCTHSWARAMRAIGVAPDIRNLFSAGGFLSQSSSRAYTLAGSFIRWFKDTRGVDALKMAYYHGDLSVVDDPELLFLEWERFLDSVAVPRADVELAEHRFRRPSILRRPCAFDVSNARSNAFAAFRSGDYSLAETWHRRAALLEPGDPWHLKGLLDVYLAEESTHKARAKAEIILSHQALDSRLKTITLMNLGDLAWRHDDYRTAQEIYSKSLSTAPSGDLQRLAAAKVLATSTPEIARDIRPFLLGEINRELAVIHLRDLLDLYPDQALIHYLLGRQLLNSGGAKWALPYLSKSVELGVPDSGGLRLESLRILARAIYEHGEDYQKAAEAWLAVSKDSAAGTGAIIEAHDWVRRSVFAKAME